MKLTATIVLMLVGVFSATTWLALELGDVVVVETRTSDSTSDSTKRQTHVWFVQATTDLYLEAGSPSNPWVQDLQHSDTIHLLGAGIDGEYGFDITSSAVHHNNIRTLMRSKYGWRDWWVDMLFDTSQSSRISLTSIHPRRV